MLIEIEEYSENFICCDSVYSNNNDDSMFCVDFTKENHLMSYHTHYDDLCVCFIVLYHEFKYLRFEHAKTVSENLALNIVYLFFLFFAAAASGSSSNKKYKTNMLQKKKKISKCL